MKLTALLILSLFIVMVRIALRRRRDKRNYLFIPLRALDRNASGGFFYSPTKPVPPRGLRD